MANYQENVNQGFDHPIFEEISNMNRKMRTKYWQTKSTFILKVLHKAGREKKLFWNILQNAQAKISDGGFK